VKHLPVIGLCLLAIASPACAQAPAFPAKSARIIVAFPPGGGTDIVARIVGQKIAEHIGHQIVIDNRGGAAGIIGTEIAAKSPPDGYTLFMGTMGNIAVNPVLYRKLPFDMERDFTPVSQVVAVTFLLYVHPTLPVRSAKELIALAKARPGQLQYGHSGNGGAPHLGGALFEAMAGVKLTAVPYKGSGPAFQDLMGGHIPLAFDSGLQGLGQVRAGKLRVIGVLGPKRTPLLPDVPTIGETLPGYSVTNWFGLVAPAATPKDIVQRWHGEVAKAIRVPEIRDKLAAQGAEAIGSSPEEFGAFIRSETTKWAKVIRESGITAE
jgi:tripartite-type tricarboxylate transporter receptor subunit TctC